MINPTLSSQLLNDAVQHFGITADIREAGYLLPCGRLLDFSGRAEDPSSRKLPRDPYKGQRSTDHRDLPDSIADALPEQPGSEANLMVRFMEATGAIRLKHPFGLSLITDYTPTEEQFRVLQKIYGYLDDEMTIDLFNSNGDTVASKDFATVRSWRSAIAMVNQEAVNPGEYWPNMR